MTTLSDVLSLPAVTVDGRDYAVADVAASAVYLSLWSAVERRASEGAACMSAPDLQPPEDDVRAAAAAFRRERRMLAAEEMEEWLARRGLSAGAWMRWVRADLARQRAPDLAQPDLVAASPAELWAEALCSGALARAARRLAELLVVPSATEGRSSYPGRGRPDPERLRALGVDVDRARAVLEELSGREAALERLAERVATPEAIDGRIRARQTDWLAVSFRALAVPEETVAREAMLCVRDDGMALEDVARLAGVAVVGQRVLLADAPAALKERLLSAGPGELVGPVQRDGEVTLVVVDAKQRPSPEDAEVTGRARRELLERALEAEISSRVRWHDRL